MSYREFGLNLTDTQKKKIASSIKAKKSVTIRLSPTQYSGPDKTMLTMQQIDKIAKHKKANTGIDISFSVTQLSKQKGGWLGALLASLAGSILPSLLSKLIPSGNGLKRKGKGLTLPGTGGRGVFLPGTRR